MAYSIKRLPFPDALANIPCTVVLYDEGVSEDGGPVVAATIDAKCIFSEHAKRTTDSDGKAVILAGKAIIKGDIAPALRTVSNGKLNALGREYEIHVGHRPRNPDGTVHHTEFELL